MWLHLERQHVTLERHSRRTRQEPPLEMEDAFRIAQADTQFIRVRKNLLYTFGATRLPYVCLSEPQERPGNVIVRKGEVMADKPQIAVPGVNFSFEGFESMGEFADEEEGGEGLAIFLARRISLPPSKYVNTAGAEMVESGPLAAAIERQVRRLDDDNDVRTGIIAAPETVWGLSVLLYVGSQVARSAPSNVQEHFERLRLQGRD